MNEIEFMIPGEVGENSISNTYLKDGISYYKFFQRKGVKNNSNLLKNDLVLGRVYSVRDKFLQVIAIKNITQNVILSDFFLIPISDVSSNFVSDLGDFFSVHDLVLFKVSDHLKRTGNTKAEELGVIYSICKFCNNRLEKDAKNKCINCKFTNNRKYSSGYDLPWLFLKANHENL